MVFFRILMIIIEVLCAFLLVGVILLQRTKSQGLGGLAFGQSRRAWTTAQTTCATQ